MKRVPFILGLAFVVVTSSRVAHFAGGDILAWFYSLGLTGSVFVTAYYLDFKTTFKRSAAILFTLIVFDTVFNLGETLRWSVESGRWRFMLHFSSGYAIPMYQIGDIIYGLFPTVAAVLMAYLAKSVERIPMSNRKGSWREKLVCTFSEWLTGKLSDNLITKVELPENKDTVLGTLPEWLPVVPKNKEHFRQLCRDKIIALPDEITSAELAKYFPVSERSVRNWLVFAKNGHKSKPSLPVDSEVR